MRRTSGILASALLLACQPPASPAQSLDPTTATIPATSATPTASSSPLANLPDELAVVGVAVPAGAKIDGDTTEWEPHRTSRRMVYVAPAPDRLIIAASLPATSRGVSLEITSAIPRVPDIGWISRGGYTHAMDAETCTHEQIPGIEGSWDEGRAHPPEVVEACMALVARREAFAQSYYQRFIRHIQLTPSEVTVDGKRVAGAVPRARDGAIEVELPLTAMPDLVEAPLETLLVRAAEGPLPTDVPLPIREYEGKPDPRWQKLELSEPIEYAPFAFARRLAFADFEGIGSALEGSRSYRPSDPEHVVTLSVPETTAGAGLGAHAPQRRAVIEASEKLYEPMEKFGDVEVGLVLGMQLVTTKNGKLVREQYIDSILGTVKRNQQLHLFTFSLGGYNPFSGMQSPPSWSVVAINEDGTLAESIADEGVDFPGDWDAWDKDPERFNDETFTKFGMRGTRKNRSKVVTWVWSEGRLRYLVSVVPRNATRSADVEAEMRRGGR